MRNAVDLDRQSRFAAEEIQDVGTHRMLPSELEAAWSATQELPEQPFGKSELTAELLRSGYGGSRRRHGCF
jgi:hypothetical protein